VSALPALFLSHGAPNVVLYPSPTRDFLSRLGTALPRPRAIVVVSAHWETDQPMLTTHAQPETIHDFYGFEPAMYQMRYAAPGAPALAADILARLAEAGITALADPQRGLDHGAWSPLMLMYPNADIPVLQLSLQTAAGPAHQLRLGQVLRPLREQGVLLVGSGNATHNLRALQRAQPDATPPAWVSDFAHWLRQCIASGDTAALLDYAAQAPYAQQNHPSAEHFLPLFFALGAGNADQPGQLLFDQYTYGALAMDSYAFH
jgi:4,5-DOPA dioxygenase extradiol